ncbi:MAG: YicC/YloC family endoribonuclease [Myxococcota bacterium]
MRSMTGYGTAREEGENVVADVEVRTVNARFSKVSIKAPSTLGAYESDLETQALKAVKRGNVALSVSLRGRGAVTPVTINEDVVLAYQAVFRRLGLPETAIPQLPGVLVNSAPEKASEDEVGAVRRALKRALEQLVGMREREGAALADVLDKSVAKLASLREQVAARIPVVVNDQRARLKERVDTLLAGSGTTLDPQTLAREVAVLADRSDVTEELDRLASHLKQARELFASAEPIGRTLDFVAQEMLREVNTIGSKSVDSELGRLVIEMKSEVERFKEQVANVE